MAITANVLTEGSGTGSPVTASVSPGANHLLLLTICSGNTTSGIQTSPSSVTGNGLTWVKVSEQNDSDTVWKTNVSVWRAMGASPTAGTISWSYSTSPQKTLWNLTEFSGVSTSGTNGSGAIGQIGTFHGSTNLTVDLGTVASTSALFGACSKNSATDTPTVGSGFTQLGTTATATSPSLARFVEWNSAAGSAHVVNMTWTLGNIAAWIGLEILAAAVASNITFRSSSTAADGAAPTSLNITKPTGVVNDDLMLAFVTIGADQTITSAPSGWTLLDSKSTGTSTGDCRNAVYWKTAASEGSSYTWSFSAGTDAAIVIVAYASVNATPIHASNSNLMVGTSTTQTGPTLTLTTTNTVVVHAFGVNGAVVGDLTFSTPTGTTSRGEADPAGTTTNRAVVAVFDEASLPTGVTTARSTTLSKASKGVAFSVALAPASVGGGPPPTNIQVQLDTATAGVSGCMLGCYEHDGYSALTANEALLDTKFAVQRVYNPAPGISTSLINSGIADGRLLMSSHTPIKRGGSWREYYTGAQDSVIDSWITYYKSKAPTQIIVIFHHEPHDDTTDLKSTPGVYGTAADYVKAFRYVAQRFRDQNADNVLIGYCAVANTWAVLGTPTGSGDKCWPGGDLVDVLCHDNYNSVGVDHNPTPGDFSNFTGSSWHSMQTIYAPVVALAKQQNKPLIMGEIGSQHSTSLGDRGDWFRDGAAWITSDADAQNFFRGFCYYHVDNHNSSGHWWRFVGANTEFVNDGKQGFIDAFSTNSYFKTVPFNVMTDNVITSGVGGGIVSKFSMGNPSLAFGGGFTVIFGAGGVASPSDFSDVEEGPTDFGTPAIALGVPFVPISDAGNIASLLAFGLVVVHRGEGTGWIFQPPIRYNNTSIPRGTFGIQRALFKYYKGAPVGQNVYVMNTGVVTESPGDMNNVVKVYHGGHIITITDAEQALLAAAGYGDYITALV